MKLFWFIFLLVTAANAQIVDTINVYSPSMKKDLKNVVILPDSYNTQSKTYPVLYLLHGAYGDYSNWITKVPEIKNYSNEYQIIIVCPDGDPFSWYFDSPVDPKYRYETYITKELIPEIDQKYHSIPSRKGRAVTGLSMGGHGAFYLTFKHPDLFGAAGSMSGGVNFLKFTKNWNLAKRLGNYEDHKDNWKNNTVINMTGMAKDKNLKLIFDCGVDDFFYEVNKELHLKLLEQNIPHDYSERPGKHNWKYWRNSIKYHMVFFNNYFYN
jgi:S-formylglutathione hydrolase FrmB